MEPAELLACCQDFLEDGEPSKAEELVKDLNHKELVVEEGWQLVGVLCRYLNIFNDQSKLDIIHKLLFHLMQVCNPKEVLLGLSEHLYKCSKKSFLVVLDLCKEALPKLKRRQSKFLMEFCSVFVTNIKGFIEVEIKDGENKGTKVKKRVFRTASDMILASLNFVDSIVPCIGRTRAPDLLRYLDESYENKSWSFYEIASCRVIIMDFLFNLFNINARLCGCEFYVKYKDVTNKLVRKVFQFISFPELLGHLYREKNRITNAVGVTTFFYLLFVGHFVEDEVPLVYQRKFLFITLQPFLNNSMESTSTFSCEVSLKLVFFLMAEIKEFFSGGEVVECLGEMSRTLTRIMIWCEKKEMRALSETLFSRVHTLILPEDRYGLLMSLYNSYDDHAGIQGYLIKHISTCLEELVRKERKLQTGIGDLALHFSKLVIGENNVLHESDRYIAALNFIRFWLLCDKRNNKKLDVLSRIDELNKTISVIVKCIDLSKQELRKQLDTLQTCSGEDGKAQPKLQTEILLSLPGGEMLPTLSSDEQRDVANKALLTLDILSSLIARIDEIVEEKGNASQLRNN